MIDLQLPEFPNEPGSFPPLLQGGQEVGWRRQFHIDLQRPLQAWDGVKDTRRLRIELQVDVDRRVAPPQKQRTPSACDETGSWRPRAGPPSLQKLHELNFRQSLIAVHGSPPCM